MLGVYGSVTHSRVEVPISYELVRVISRRFFRTSYVEKYKKVQVGNDQ